MHKPRARTMALEQAALPYYHTGITKVGAEQILRGASEGSFLLRPRQSTRDGLCAVCVTRSGVKHYAIVCKKRQGHGVQWSLENARPQLFTSLRRLIAHYTLHPLSRKDQTCLAHPITRPGSGAQGRATDGHSHGHEAAGAGAHTYEEPGGPCASHEYADVLPGAFYSATAPNAAAPTTTTRDPRASASASATETETETTERSFLQRCAKSNSELRAAVAGLGGACGGADTAAHARPRDAGRADRLKQELAHFFTNALSARQVQGLDLSSLLATTGHAARPTPPPRSRLAAPEYASLSNANATYASTHAHTAGRRLEAGARLASNPNLVRTKFPTNLFGMVARLERRDDAWKSVGGGHWPQGGVLAWRRALHRDAGEVGRRGDVARPIREPGGGALGGGPVEV